VMTPRGEVKSTIVRGAVPEAAAKV
jgi:hypothetical protein